MNETQVKAMHKEISEFMEQLSRNIISQLLVLVFLTLIQNSHLISKET